MVLPRLLLALAMLVAAISGPRAQTMPARGPVIGVLAGNPAWPAWRDRFVTAQGRVVDTGNGGVSHSEGQGYGMLLAVAAGDRASFDRIWGWTRANLMVRDDALLAWRWEPDRRPGVADLNPAADGDLLVAWALTEASEAWPDAAYRVAARRSATAIGQKLILRDGPDAPLLLPGANGFSTADRPDGPIVNPSYWVFPAFERLPLVAPEIDWDGLSRSGRTLLSRVRLGPLGLPPDWVSLAGQAPAAAAGFDPEFGYNGIRIPLYLAWSQATPASLLAPFLSAWGEAAPAVVDVASGRTRTILDEPGYRALPALAACAARGTPVPAALRAPSARQNYYPATLHLLAIVAAKARHPECLP